MGKIKKKVNLNPGLVVREKVNEVRYSPEGMVSSEKKNVSYKQRHFVCMYLNNMKFINRMRGIDLAVMMVVMQFSTYVSQQNMYGGNILHTNRKSVEKYAEILKMSVGNVKRWLSILEDRDILRKVDTATYQINPVFFGKGRTNDVSGLLLRKFTTDEYDEDIDEGDAGEEERFVYYDKNLSTVMVGGEMKYVDEETGEILDEE